MTICRRMSAEVTAAYNTAVCTATKLVCGQWRTTTTPQKNLEKGDPDVGHHAIVTQADVEAQKNIVRALSQQFPSALFLTEEKTDRSQRTLLTDDKLKQLRKATVFAIDPIDGTAMYFYRLYQWSVSIGVIRNGEHTGGVIAMPAVTNGTVVWGERKKGIFLREGNKPDAVRCSVSDRSNKKEWVINTGSDLNFLPQFSRFNYETSRQIRASCTTGSCAFGLAMVAAGRIDGLIQPVQGPWDWAAGYPLVEEAGGKVQFYHYRDNQVVAMEKPDLNSYSPTRRNIAFIAGSPQVTDWLFNMLQQYWRQTVDPARMP